MGIECRRRGVGAPAVVRSSVASELAARPQLSCSCARQRFGRGGRRRIARADVDEHLRAKRRQWPTTASRQSRRRTCAGVVGRHSWDDAGRAARKRSRQERLDAHHLTLAALRAVAQRFAGQALVLIQVVRWLVGWRRRGRREKLATLLELDLTVAVRQQPVVAYALQARRQDV